MVGICTEDAKLQKQQVSKPLIKQNMNQKQNMSQAKHEIQEVSIMLTKGNPQQQQHVSILIQTEHSFLQADVPLFYLIKPRLYLTGTILS